MQKLRLTEVSLPPISSPYLLVTCITCYRDSQGNHYVDQLWYKDLVEHVKYLKNFVLAHPCKQIDSPEGMICLENDPAFTGVRFLDLPAPESLSEALQSLPTTLIQLWSAIGEAEIVHSGVAGWPIPPAWYTTPILLFRKRFYLMIVESAFWRLEPGVSHALTARIRAFFSEILNRWCLNQTNLAIFSQQEWRESLLTSKRARSMVVHCSWIDEKNIVSDSEARHLWQQKIAPDTRSLKVILAGRLEESKGVKVLLRAMELLNAENVPVQLNILGRGTLFDECVRASQAIKGSVEVNVLGTVPYGPELFTLLAQHHALVLPSLSDEPVRIVYDVYSQAVPVLASDTTGLRDCVRAGETGVHFTVNDPAAIADTFKWALGHLDQLEKMGMASLAVARSLTHQEMHRHRQQVLLEMLAKSAAT